MMCRHKSEFASLHACRQSVQQPVVRSPGTFIVSDFLSIGVVSSVDAERQRLLISPCMATDMGALTHPGIAERGIALSVGLPQQSPRGAP